MDDYRKMASMAQFGAVGGAAITGRLEGTYNKNKKWLMKN
jgi:hypothetical protein